MQRGRIDYHAAFTFFSFQACFRFLQIYIYITHLYTHSTITPKKKEAFSVVCWFCVQKLWLLIPVWFVGIFYGFTHDL